MAADERTPIRVELVDSGTPSQVESPATRWQREPAEPHRTGFVAAIGAVVVAALVGIVVGRASSSSDDGSGDAASSPVVESSPTGTVVETIAPVTAAETPVTTSPVDAGSPSTAEGPAVVAGVEGAVASDPVVTTRVELDARLAGTALTLVAPRQDGTWVRLDLRDGDVDEIADIDPSTFLTDQPVVAGDGWLLYATAEGSPAAALWRDATATWELVPATVGGRLLREAGTDSMWRPVEPGPDADATSPGRLMELWDVNGPSDVGTSGGVDRRLVVPPAASVVGSDPAGGLIARAGGRLFGVGPDGSTVFGDGDLVAADELVVVAWVCDETLVCGFAVTDRSTGVTEPIEMGESPVGPPSDVELLGASDLSAALTDDGRHLAVNVVGETGYELVVVDLVSGGSQRVAGHSRPFSVLWTPDGRFLLHTNLGVPYAFDRETGEAFPVTPTGRLGGWNGIVAVR